MDSCCFWELNGVNDGESHPPCQTSQTFQNRTGRAVPFTRKKKEVFLFSSTTGKMKGVVGGRQQKLTGKTDELKKKRKRFDGMGGAERERSQEEDETSIDSGGVGEKTRREGRAKGVVGDEQQQR